MGADSPWPPETHEPPEPHEVTIVDRGHAARWRCSCGAGSGGRWFGSVEEAEKRARAHASGRADSQ